MSRLARLLLLTLGLGMVAFLVRRAGVQLVLAMLRQVGWSFPLVAALYAAHLVIRATALWRSVLGGRVSYSDVLRIRLSGEAVEMLTFTGPFLAEPAKGVLLKYRGLTTAQAFAAVATEYLLYTVVSSWMLIVALLLLLARGTLPPAFRPGAFLILIIAMAFMAAVAFASTSGIGLLVPIARTSRLLVGAARAERVTHELGLVEDVLISFLHAHPDRLAQVFVMEAAAQMLLVWEIRIVFAALGLTPSWSAPLVVEGGIKFITIAFFFIPGQVGASEAAYALLLSAIGLSPAAGLTLALVRRIRSLLVAAAGVVAIAFLDRR